MRIVWEITEQDAQEIRDVVERHRHVKAVQDRIVRNAGDKKQPISRDEVWRVIVSCLTTTQQRSGPESVVGRFLELKPFPLSYEVCKRMGADLDRDGARMLTTAGIWRAKIIGRELQRDMDDLEANLWPDLVGILEELHGGTTAQQERKAARYVADHLTGFGPKQSRNFLQELGLTRFETPIDSRIAKWLNRHGFPLQLNAAGLADEHYYCFVADGFQALCAKAGILPCIADAAIFASFDARTAEFDTIIATLRQWES